MTTGLFKKLSLSVIEAKQQRFRKILSTLACRCGKGVAVTSKPRHPETFHSKPKRFWGKISKYANKKQSTWQLWCLVLVQRPCSSCCGDGFCAVVMFSVPWHCASCCGQSVHAATIFFFPWHCATCHSVVLCAMASFFMPRRHSLCRGNALRAAASLWLSRHRSLCHGEKRLAAALHGILRHHFYAPLHSAASRAIPWRCSLCCGHISLCHSKK